MIDKLTLNVEKSRKNFIEEIDNEVGDSVLINTWLFE